VDYADPDTYGIYTESALTVQAMITQATLTTVSPTHPLEFPPNRNPYTNARSISGVHNYADMDSITSDLL